MGSEISIRDRFTSGTHRLTREVHTIAKLHVVWSAVVSSLAILLPLIAMLGIKSAGPPKCQVTGPVRAIPLIDGSVGIVLIALIAHTVWVLFWVHRYERFCNQDYENKEYILRSVLLDGTLQREAVSVMETGAWDVEYLTDRYAWFFAGKFDVRAYLKPLQSEASAVADRVVS